MDRSLDECLGQALRQLRNAKGLKQEDFLAVVSEGYISKLERGLKSPSIATMQAIAEVLDVQVLTWIALCQELRGSTSAMQLLEVVASELDLVRQERP